MPPMPADTPKEASGRFVLRLSPGLHAALRAAAAAAGTSLNDYCIQKLAAPLGSLAGLENAAALVEHAAAALAGRLQGLVAFGSWARGEAGPGSDLDLLIVVPEDVSLSRRLYRQWGDAEIVVDGLRVEPHFVHLPATGVVVTGVWAEAALDGIVLFEQGLTVSRRLGQVRRDVAEGRIVRRVVHGQAYWAAA
jgi:hypothetical protein